MNKEEAKQYIRNQIDSCVKRLHQYNNSLLYLCYNKSYLRALKLSKITGKPVNKENFKCGERTFEINTETKKIWYYSKISKYLDNNYSISYSVQIKTITEVLNEYDEYKGYKAW